jgi:hypothetical protein
MREDLERSELKGVLPAILVFMARTGKEIKGIDYLSLDKAGTVVQEFQGATRGAKVTFTDSATGAQKVLYYFTSDLSDDALKRNPGLLRFCEGLEPANSLLKAASYLLHEGGFETVRNFLLQNSVAILQDDSGIPVHFFAPDRTAVYRSASPQPLLGSPRNRASPSRHCSQAHRVWAEH